MPEVSRGWEPKEINSVRETLRISYKNSIPCLAKQMPGMALICSMLVPFLRLLRNISQFSVIWFLKFQPWSFKKVTVILLVCVLVALEAKMRGFAMQKSYFRRAVQCLVDGVVSRCSDWQKEHSLNACWMHISHCFRHQGLQWWTKQVMGRYEERLSINKTDQTW